MLAFWEQRQAVFPAGSHQSQENGLSLQKKLPDAEELPENRPAQPMEEQNFQRSYHWRAQPEYGSLPAVHHAHQGSA